MIRFEKKPPQMSTRRDDAMFKDEVRRVAYELYAKRGYKQGNDMGDWFEAERIVQKRMGREGGMGNV